MSGKCRNGSHSFDTYGVKRGLRDKAGNGVVAGLTNISDVSAYWFDEQGNKHPQEGKLSYRGYNINDLVNGFVREKRFGFEETTYLLLFSKLPDEKNWQNLLSFSLPYADSQLILCAMLL